MKRSNLRRVSKTPLSKLKRQLWQLCRQIIIKQHGTNCYTCGARNLVGSNLHLGHFIPSSVCSAEVRYSLANLRPCCYRCNIHLSGNWPAYEAHLKADGIDVEALKQRNRDTCGMKADSLYYTRKIAEYNSLLLSENRAVKDKWDIDKLLEFKAEAVRVRKENLTHNDSH